MSERQTPDQMVESDAGQRPEAVADAKIVRIENWARKHRRPHVDPDNDSGGPDPGPSAA